MNDSSKNSCNQRKMRLSVEDLLAFVRARSLLEHRREDPQLEAALGVDSRIGRRGRDLNHVQLSHKTATYALCYRADLYNTKLR